MTHINRVVRLIVLIPMVFSIGLLRAQESLPANGSIPVTSTISTEQLRAIYDEHDKQSQAIAAKARDAETKLGKDHADVVKLKAELRDSVQQSLLARQHLHRAELAEFRNRVQRLQQSIEARDRIVDRIVKRRFDELLDPDSNWDSTENESLNTNPTDFGNQSLGDERLIHASDILNVSIRAGSSSSDEITLGARVGSNGFINLPEIGDVEVAGIRTIEAEQRVFEQLKAMKLFRSPIVLISFIDRPADRERVDRFGRASLQQGPAVMVPSSEFEKKTVGKSGADHAKSGGRDSIIAASIKFLRDSSMSWSSTDPDGISRRTEMPKVNQMGISTDRIGRLKFHDIRGLHRWEIFLEIDPTASASLADDELRNVSIPLKISETELTDLISGTVITKAAYKPNGTQADWRADAGVVSSQGYGQDIDPVEIAKRQGKLLAVVRISAKQTPVKRIKSQKELDGTWRLISEKSANGTWWPISEKSANRNNRTAGDLLVLDENEYSEKMQASRGSSKGRIQYGFASDPQTIDFQIDAKPLPFIMRQIFELEGTTLRIARTVDADGKNRIWNPPKSFDASDATILTYQRFSVVIGKSETGDTVEISLGSNDRLQVGQQLQVFSKREPVGDVEVVQLVGEVEVVSVKENQSTAKVLEAVTNQVINIGDRVEPKPTASGAEQ